MKQTTQSEVSRYRSFSIRRALQVHTHLWSEHVSPEITPVQYGVLVMLSENDSLSQRDLSRLLQLDKSTLAELLRRMQAHGLLDTARSLADRRTNIVMIAPGGRRALAELRPRAIAVNELLVSGLDDDEKRTLDHLLEKLLNSEVGVAAAIR